MEGITSIVKEKDVARLKTVQAFQLSPDCGDDLFVGLFVHDFIATRQNLENFLGLQDLLIFH